MVSPAKQARGSAVGKPKASGPLRSYRSFTSAKCCCQLKAKDSSWSVRSSRSQVVEGALLGMRFSLPYDGRTRVFPQRIDRRGCCQPKSPFG